MARAARRAGRVHARAGEARSSAPAEPPPVAAAPPPPTEPPPAVAAPELLAAVATAAGLVDAYRSHGHLAARLDPLGSEPIGDPELDTSRLHPLTPELASQIPAALLGLHVPAETLAEALPLLEETYCGTMAYEIEHISDHEERRWLRWAIESGQFRQPLAPEERRRLLERLSTVEAFEQYLRRAFLGQKQFSIEGLDALVPMLDESIELAARQGAHGAVIGMAHRGRLSVLARTLGQPYEAILREFEGERAPDAVVGNPEGGTGDVKYHLGAEGAKRPRRDDRHHARLEPQPPRGVDPVVEGWTRANQTDRSAATGRHSPSVALPILIHGDASFAGQGVVAETFNLEGLPGYSTGGTLHLIANNQVGFTTDPTEGRSTRYSSDLAKGFDAPIIHVNADDPEAAVSATRLAMAFRERFGHDVVVDLVGYRRFGHNEQDEPAYTQPLMAQAIADHPTVRAQLAERIVAEGEVTSEEAERMVAETHEAMRVAHDRLREAIAEPHRKRRARRRQAHPTSSRRWLPTGYAASIASSSPSPSASPSIPSSCASSSGALDALEEGGIDWGHAEALALGSLLVEGIPVRLRGRTRSAERSRIATSSSTTRSPASATRRSSTSRTPRPRSSSNCPSPSTARSASTTAIRWRRRGRSCSGRPSSATS